MDFAETMLVSALAFALAALTMLAIMRQRFASLIAYMRRKHPNLPYKFGVENTQHSPLRALALKFNYFASRDYTATRDAQVIRRGYAIRRWFVAAISAALCSVIAGVIAYAHSITV